LDLPIKEVLHDLRQSLVHKDCLVIAPPGAGKSTFLPLELLKVDAFKHKQILLLQPRQVAVRSIANFLASQLNEKVGNTIGYQMRGESAVSANTKLCVITEALLTSKIQRDPELSDVGLIIFDEFHERSLHSDIALGLSVEVQAGLREDLRLLVMSATLNTEQVKRVLPNAELLISKGRSYPIEYIYRPVKILSTHSHKSLEQSLLSVINEALTEHSGHILVFLPGAGLINKLMRLLSSKVTDNVVIYPLFGALSPEQQKRAINLPPQGKRKIVLATNIAETSLTIDGVNIVVDSGREKVQRINVNRKANQLSEQMISKASSIQRAGRAGRQQAGVCYRMYSAEQQASLSDDSSPQILETDVSQSLLTLLEWGTSFDQLPLVDRPSKAQLDYARVLLTNLHLMDEQSHLSALGKQAANFQNHPRLSTLLALGTAPNKHAMFDELSITIQPIVIACLVALVEGKNIRKSFTSHQKVAQSHVSNDFYQMEIVHQCEFILQAIQNKQFAVAGEIQKEIKRLARKLKVTDVLRSINTVKDLSSQVANLLLIAFPDKLGLLRSENTYALADGTGVEFSQGTNQYAGVTSIRYPKWIVCVQSQIVQNAHFSNRAYEKSNSDANAKIHQFCELPEHVMSAYLQNNQKTRTEQSWDTKLNKVKARQIVSVGKIEISSQACELMQNQDTTNILLTQIRLKGLAHIFHSSNKNKSIKSAMTLLNKVRIAKQIDAEHVTDFPQTSLEHLNQTLDLWLLPYLNGVISWQQILELNWADIIKSLLTWEQCQYLENHFPTQISVPSGNKHRLDYSDESVTGTSVTLALRMQELYGWQQTPSVGKNRLPITLSILSPAHREIQKTADLDGFWKGSYKEVQKEMKGRYPKHFWPDDPANAIATTKTKRNM
jgi:ATP-dependent helicase HrpB